MSFLGKLFGKKSAKTPSLPQVIKEINTEIKELVKMQHDLESKIIKEKATAQENALKNKKSALNALQRKKKFERKLQQLDGILTTLEGKKELLERANINTLAFSSMNKAAKSLKRAQKQLDVDKLNEIFDDLAEQGELVNEITEAIIQPIPFEDLEFDQNEVLEELANLEKSLGKANLSAELPDVPQNDVKDSKNKSNHGELGKVTVS